MLKVESMVGCGVGVAARLKDEAQMLGSVICNLYFVRNTDVLCNLEIPYR
jgi:hypothetical protein